MEKPLKKPSSIPPGFPASGETVTWPPFMEMCPMCGDDFLGEATLWFNDSLGVYEHSRCCPKCGSFTRRASQEG